MKALSGRGFSSVLVVLKSLQILSENRDELQTLVNHGLTTKVLLWFKTIHDLLTSDPHRSSASLHSLTEEFYDYFRILSHSSLSVSQVSVVLVQLVQSSLEPQIHFPVRLEAIRTLNRILESVSSDQRKLIQNHQNQNLIQNQLAAAVLSAGDYELQVSLSEALCRLTPRKQRQLQATHWFSSCDIRDAFCDIRDGDFEVDCRRFLNFVNTFHGNQRRVFSFPCVRVFLDSTQLFRPKDDKLDEFWIDFNVGSGCVSFFVNDPNGYLWDSVHLLREDVSCYSFQVKHDGQSLSVTMETCHSVTVWFRIVCVCVFPECTGTETVLSVHLNNPIMHHSSRGQRVELIFSCDYQRDLQEAAERVFMSGRSSPSNKASGSTVQAPPPVRSYSRKKPQKKSHLKILPLSSPSSEDDSSVSKTPSKSRAEILFDQIRHSTPNYSTGVPVGAEPVVSHEYTVEVGEGPSAVQQEVVSSDRKRAAADSGYLSDHTEGSPAHKKKVEPQAEREGSVHFLNVDTGSVAHLDSVWSPEGVGPLTDVEEPFGEGVGGEGSENTLGVRPESDLTSGFTNVFKNLKAELEQHMTSCWKKVEQNIHLSLNECQQQVTSLLTAVHQHRLSLLQNFENIVTDELKHLEENSTQLNNLNTQIQTQIQRLGSFCNDQLIRLKRLESRDSEDQDLRT
ncbi:synaptonemal complex protein 2-like [Solea solea]|uniref:synaptonemal complex protein 2-like n=1 Tax=Solea solea TaxID=90069 RepID=UPI00272D3516|nr:synaptonemal complex protein 2-like [Solea solea]